MKRLFLTLLLLIAVFGASSTLAPRLAHASTTRADMYTASCDSSDGSYNYYDQGTRNILGYQDEGNGCLAFDPNYVPSDCSNSDLCWDVQAATNLSPSVYQTFAEAEGWDQCDGGEWIQELYSAHWFSGSAAVSSQAYGPFQTCSTSHDYQGDYGHFFEYSSSSGSFGWTVCEYDTPTGCV